MRQRASEGGGGTRSVRALVVAAIAALGLAIAPSTALADWYNCYWATSGCAFGGLAPSSEKTSAYFGSLTERPFMNNQHTGTSKRIERWDFYGGFDGAWLGGQRIWVVQLAAAQSKQYRCINLAAGNVSVSCGNYHSN